MQDEIAAVRIFSDFAGRGLTTQRRLPELRWRAAVSLAEDSAEMTVAGEAEIQAQSGQVIILREKIQRPRQS